jgi:lipopolysaccharide transport system ATP-binding protein
MSDIVISVEKLSKRYRISLGEEQAKTWPAALRQSLGRPFSYLREMMRPPTEDEILWALRDVSFEVRRGEVVGVIGRNGAGKSTLLKILSQITDPTEGRAVIKGRVGSLLEVGTGFHPELTGRENVHLSGAILGMKRREIEQKFDEIVDFAGIERFIDTPVKRYSSGMRVRLAFAVAAHLEPEIMIVDEVLAVGDLAFQQKCLGKMDDVAHGGRTVLFVSHSMPTIARLCPRSILLENGHVVVDSDTPSAIRAYTNDLLKLTEIQSWELLEDAPGDEVVRLLVAGIFNDDGTPASLVDITQPLQIKIGYHVSQPNRRLRCAASVFTQNVCAFSAIEPADSGRQQPGYYESVVSIPANFLSEGDHSVNISIFSSRGAKVWHVSLKSALNFQVYDPMNGRSVRGDYAHNFNGVVRPHLNWQLHHHPNGTVKEGYGAPTGY